MKPGQPSSGAPNAQTVRDIESISKSRMEKALSDFQHDMASLRTGRASVNLLDSVRVDAWGTPSPLTTWPRCMCPSLR